MAHLLPFRARFRVRICLGFYCTGFVTATVMFVLYCLLCVEYEVYRIQQTGGGVQRKYVAWNVHLPSRMIYRQGELKIVKVDDSGVVYSNSLEEDILNLSWVKELQRMLAGANASQNPQVNLVVADENSIELLLNWLIAALVRLTEPLRNVIVLGLDSQVCEMLNYRTIPCVHANPATFLQPGEKLVNFLPVFSAPQTRLLSVRLVNYWGYSLASYDTDAIVLRNPQPLYDAHRGANIIAGAGGHWPIWAIREWGFAVCLGAMMIRNGPGTEELWRQVSVTWGDWGSEQDQFNRALRYNIVWNMTTPNNTSPHSCQQKYGWKGVLKKASLLIVPHSQFCRGECCDEYEKSELYVAHGGGGKIGNVAGKIRHMMLKGVWFLRGNWREVSEESSATGVHWLEQLSTL